MFYLMRKDFISREAILGSNRKRVTVTKRGVLPHSILTDLRTHSQRYHIFVRLFPVGTISKRNTARKEKASEILKALDSPTNARVLY